MSMTFKLNQRRQESKSPPIITYANNEGDQAAPSGKFRDTVVISMNQLTSNQQKVAIETHGCKLNQADSQALAREFSAAGFQVVGLHEQVDIFVLNSCTVTHVADRKARHSLRSARRKNPDATIVATGCYAERNPTELMEISEIDIVMGNGSKRAIVQRLVDSLELPIVPCATGEDIDVIPLSLNRNRAMVKIQEGCDQVCAYCIVPKVRGREKSVPVATIIEQITAYQDAGFHEVVLTGTQLGSYGFDLEGESIASLIRHVLNRTRISRIRVSSLQPQDITSDLLELWDNPRLCPHFHLPLQSGSDNILSQMRRRYTASQYSQSVDAIRNRVQDVAITADVIVGFPGETDDDFEHTFRVCQHSEFADIHVFPYSTRPGTSAAYLPDSVASEVKNARSSSILQWAEIAAKSFREQHIGTTRSVLWEKRVNGGDGQSWTGLTDNYLRVTTVSSENLGNEITQAHLFELDGKTLRADVKLA